MKTLTCPWCNRRVVKRRRGKHWRVVPVHTVFGVDQVCRGSGMWASARPEPYPEEIQCLKVR